MKTTVFTKNRGKTLDAINVDADEIVPAEEEQKLSMKLHFVKK